MIGGWCRERGRGIRRRLWVVGGTLVLALMLGRGSAWAIGCAQPVTTGPNPVATDCLFILKAAVGLSQCDPACICDPDGTGTTTASDALRCLMKAVGFPVELLCPCGSTTTTTVTVTTTSLGPATTTTTLPLSASRFWLFTKKDPGSTFQTADVAGLWRMHALGGGAMAGWWGRGDVAVANDGTMTGTLTDNTGASSPLVGMLQVAPDGTVTMIGDPNFLASVDPDLDVIVGTTIPPGSPTGSLMLVVLLRRGSSYAQADLVGNWYLGETTSGADSPWWSYGAISADASGALSGTMHNIDGTTDSAAGATLVLSAQGILTIPGMPTFQGALDRGKTFVAGTSTDTDGGITAVLDVLVRQAAGGYGAGDLTGGWAAYMLTTGGPSESWWRGSITVTSSGSYTGTLTDEAGGSHNVSGTWSIDGSTGQITRAGDPDMHCGLDSGKTVIVCTDSE